MKMVRITFAMLVAAVANAGEVPTTGIVYNTKEASSLTYSCSPINSEQFRCEFVQTSVRKSATASDFDAESARKEFQGNGAPSKEECSQYKAIVDVLEGRKVAPRPEGLAAITGMQRKDLLDGGKAFLNVCQSKTEESWMRFAEFAHSRKVRTCLVSSNNFQQTFRRVGDTVTGTSAWVVQSEPQGNCGMVELSRFEPDKPDGSSLSFWRYIARKAITNVNGALVPGVPCKGLDQKEYAYDWRSRELPLQCDYIEFSPL